MPTLGARVLVVACIGSFSQAYFLGEDKALCWQAELNDGKAGDCPPGLDLVWVTRPPNTSLANMLSREAEGQKWMATVSASYELKAVGKMTPWREIGNVIIPHANLHACRQSVGPCEPQLKAASDGELELVTLERAQVTNESRVRSAMNLTIGVWSVVAHVEYYTSDRKKWDVARGVLVKISRDE